MPAELTSVQLFALIVLLVAVALLLQVVGVRLASASGGYMWLPEVLRGRPRRRR